MASFACQAQTYSALKGKIYRNHRELYQLINCIQVDARVDDRYTCRLYKDTITDKYIVFVEKQHDTSLHANKILDIVLIDRTRNGEYVIIGSDERNILNSQYSFVIAVDCCYNIQENEDLPVPSTLIHKAWTFNRTKNRLEKLNPHKIYRINEGFYLRSR